MVEKETPTFKGYTLLPECSRYAPNLIIVAACDGASKIACLDTPIINTEM
jgi:hypothetical protein